MKAQPLLTIEYHGQVTYHFLLCAVKNNAYDSYEKRMPLVDGCSRPVAQQMFHQP